MTSIFAGFITAEIMELLILCLEMGFLVASKRQIHGMYWLHHMTMVVYVYSHPRTVAAVAISSEYASTFVLT